MLTLRRSRRMLAASILAGGFVLQWGSCAAGLTNFLLGAIDFCALTLTPDCTIGPIAPCGRPNVATFDPTTGEIGDIQFDEDDLLLDCPVTLIPVGGGT